jgi:hypothetical protein
VTERGGQGRRHRGRIDHHADDDDGDDGHDGPIGSLIEAIINSALRGAQLDN